MKIKHCPMFPYNVKDGGSGLSGRPFSLFTDGICKFQNLVHRNSVQSRGGHWPPCSSNGPLLKLEWTIFNITGDKNSTRPLVITSEI